MGKNPLWKLLAVLAAFGLVAAACGSDDDDTASGDTDGVLTIGGLLPETGNLAFLGPPEIAGVQLAVNDINAAGGVLGEDVVWLPGDSGDNGDVANATVDRLLAEDVDGPRSRGRWSWRSRSSVATRPRSIWSRSRRWPSSWSSSKRRSGSTGPSACRSRRAWVAW